MVASTRSPEPGTFLARAGSAYGLSPAAIWAIVLAPAVIAGVLITLMFIGATREAAIWFIKGEYRPVELSTFVFFTIGGLIGIRLTWRSYRRGEPLFVTLFFAVFTLGLLVVAGEEIAWGQKFLLYPTPPAWRRINAQWEVTLHNIRGMQGHTEYLRMSFAGGGLIGLFVSRWEALRKIATPSLLASWFGIIAVLAGIDYYTDIFPTPVLFKRNMGYYMSEALEMMISMAGMLYVILHLLARRRQDREA